jgi:outer membrane protein insertion porin family
VKYPIPQKWVTLKSGFDVRFGHPIFEEYTIGYITYKLENVRDLDVQASPEEVAADQGLSSSVIFSIVRDKRNNRFETTGGNYQSASLETAGFGGEKKFVKWVLNNRYYHKVVGDLIFRNSTEVGNIFNYAGVPTPPSQKFYLGGPNNMKGFALYSLGPQKVDPDGTIHPLGGSVEAYTLLELEYPLIREAGIKLVAFFDAGNSWSHFPSGALDDPFIIRTDVGFGFRWFSPIGPLRFEWGFPLARRSNEPSPQFQFFIGPPF